MSVARTALGLLAVTAFFAPAPAAAHGPFGSVGATITTPRTLGGVDYDGFAGPMMRVGWEFGGRWNSEVSAQFTQAGSRGTYGGETLTVSFSTYAVGYRFAVDILGKEGFTPYVGTGVYVGVLTQARASSGDVLVADDSINPLLEFHASAGARYTLPSGLNFRGEVTGSTYGGLFAIQPSVGVGYQF